MASTCSEREIRLYSARLCLYNAVKFNTIFALILILFSSSSTCLKPIVWEEQILFISKDAGDLGEVDTYRIPIAINASNGDLLVFAEARKFSAGDSGAKFLTMRRSKDKGASWAPTEFIVNDAVVPDGLNLGVVMYAYETDELILLYNFCGHDSNASKCVTVDKAQRGVYMIRSKNSGYSWTSPFNLAEYNSDFTNFPWTGGPGQGFQKRLRPYRGRLVACGHTQFTVFNNHNIGHSMYCIYSDDNGYTWNIGAKIVGLPTNIKEEYKAGDLVPGESQLVELPDGSLLIAIRNTHWYHCHCRIHAYSYDGGETVNTEDIFFDEQLLDPNVCGSILLQGDMLYFANAFHHDKRLNMTLRWSPDYGVTWPGMLQIYSGGSGYPCLTSIDNNHIGLVYEKNGYKEISFVKVRLNP